MTRISNGRSVSRIFRDELSELIYRKEAMKVIHQWVQQGEIDAEEMAALAMMAWKRLD